MVAEKQFFPAILTIKPPLLIQEIRLSMNAALQGLVRLLI